MCMNMRITTPIYHCRDTHTHNVFSSTHSKSYAQYKYIMVCLHVVVFLCGRFRRSM